MGREEFGCRAKAEVKKRIAEKRRLRFPVCLVLKVSHGLGRGLGILFDITRYQAKLQKARREIAFLEKQLVKEMKKRAHLEAKLSAVTSSDIKAEEQKMPTIAIHLGFLGGASGGDGADFTCGRPGHIIRGTARDRQEKDKDSEFHCWGTHPGYILGDNSHRQDQENDHHLITIIDSSSENNANPDDKNILLHESKNEISSLSSTPHHNDEALRFL